MASISDRTRKILWAKSGNRCAICKIELVQKEEGFTSDVVVGEECHIISSKPNGPRGDQERHCGVDDYDNLLLLCANDHKKIDDQVEVFTVLALLVIKGLHEQWVQKSLSDNILAFTNDKLNVKTLAKMSSGRQLMDLMECHAYLFDNDQLKSPEEAELVGNMIQTLQDLTDIMDVFEAKDRIDMQFHLDGRVKELSDAGFLIFGIKRKMRYKHETIPSLNNTIAITSTILIVRDDNPSINGDFLIAKFPDNSKMKF